MCAESLGKTLVQQSLFNTPPEDPGDPPDLLVLMLLADIDVHIPEARASLEEWKAKQFSCNDARVQDGRTISQVHEDRKRRKVRWYSYRLTNLLAWRASMYVALSEKAYKRSNYRQPEDAEACAASSPREWYAKH